MINLTTHIIELLRQKEALNLPNFGCFLTVKTPSYTEEGKIYPPSKKLIFRTDYKDEEYYFINYIVSKEKISFNKALQEVQKEINSIKETILTHKKYEFSDLGYFYLNPEGDIDFYSNPDLNLNLFSYGLNKI